MLLYLSERFIFRIGDFFHHWYRDGMKVFANYTVSFFAGLDKGFALSANARHFFEPLYGDYTITGHIMGLLFRTARIVIGLLAYVVFAVGFAAAALIWLLLPPLLVIYAIIY